MPQEYDSKQKLSKRKIFTAMLIFVLIPLTLFFSIFVLKNSQVYITSLLIVLYTLIIFFAGFERRNPQAKEVVIIAVMSAIAIAGRSVFFFIPQFKPVIAIVIITGVCLGAESGFLTGAVSGFVSNFFFGQGPWTPWQMFAFGLTGLLAGILFKKGRFRHTKLNLCIFGGLCTLIIYGGLLNLSTFFMSGTSANPTSILTVFAAGVIFDLIHVAATVIFLFLIADTMIEKLERVKTKYGLME